MAFSFLSACDCGRCIKIANNGKKRQMKYEIGESPLQNCFFSPEVSRLKIRCSLKLKMKLKTLKTKQKKKTNSHPKTLF